MIERTLADLHEIMIDNMWTKKSKSEFLLWNDNKIIIVPLWNCIKMHTIMKSYHSKTYPVEQSLRVVVLKEEKILNHFLEGIRKCLKIVITDNKPKYDKLD